MTTMTTTTVRDIADLMRDLPKPSATLQQVEEWLNRKQELLGRLAVEQHAQQDRETDARRKGIEMGRLLGRVADPRGGHTALRQFSLWRAVSAVRTAWGLTHPVHEIADLMRDAPGPDTTHRPSATPCRCC